MKFLIAKTNSEGKLYFLVDKSNRLFEAETIWEAEQNFRNIFGATLQIGKGIEAEELKDCFFAAALGDMEGLQDGWSFVESSNLKPENCSDYDIIKIAQEKLGY